MIKRFLYLIFSIVALNQNLFSQEDFYKKVIINASLIHGMGIGDLFVKETNKQLHISGFNLNIISGNNYSVSGVDLSLVLGEYNSNSSGLILNGGASAIVFGGCRGVQISGLFNYVQRDFSGLQTSALVNAVGGDFYGAQISAGLNTIKSDLNGAQLTFFNNSISGTLNGAQISLVNVADKVGNGAQFGLVNVSDYNEGASLGLVSYVKSVGFEFDVWFDDLNFINLSAHTGNNFISNNLFFGVSLKEIKSFTTGFGIGYKKNFSSFMFESDILYQIYLNVKAIDESRDNASAVKFRLLGVIPVSGTTKVFFGPAINIFNSKNISPEQYSLLSIRNVETNSKRQNIWIGFAAGVRLMAF